METKTQSPALVMRGMKITFIISGFLYFYVAMKFISQAQTPVTGAVQLAITIVAFTCIAVGFLVPRFVFRAAEITYQSNPALPPFKRWITKGIISLAFFEACILFGFVLHVLGAPSWRVELLFGAGIAAMLLWSPGTPPGAARGEFPQV